MKKRIQAELTKKFQAMTLRLPTPMHEEFIKKGKKCGKSLNKMNIEAIAAYLKK